MDDVQNKISEYWLNDIYISGTNNRPKELSYILRISVLKNFQDKYQYKIEEPVTDRVSSIIYERLI